jgi:NAD(P)-dependent dehydrogenase (short-subunit alcohol dehydrogenase family)
LRVFVDFRNQAVLVTGGTMGIGLATALAFAERGAQCWLTYRWGTADEDDIRARFAAVGGPPPRLVLADAASDEDTEALLMEMRATHHQIDVFVSNVSAAPVVSDLDDYSSRALFKSIEYSAWPLVEYTRRINQRFGRYPRYVVGMSSTGVDAFSVGYDFVAASKAVLETLSRYLNYRLFDQDVRINIVRSRSVRTESFEAHFGSDFGRFAQRFTRESHFLSADEVAQVVVALCSGLMDGVSGQVLTVDRGTTFFDNLMRLYDEREELDL